MHAHAMPLPAPSPAQFPESIASGYDALADEYTRRIYRELNDKPFDRGFLDRLAALLQRQDLVVDLGCGPGHVGRYLQDRGVRVCGVDISPRMVELAVQQNPGMAFLCADMRAPVFADESIGAIAACYSIIHIPQANLKTIFDEMFRVLRPGGLLALAFHRGDKVVRVDELWGIQVQIDFCFFELAPVCRTLSEAGFGVLEAAEREPYGASVEAQTRRGYVLAQRP
jgi:SAM-dependent methyltransferase